MDATATRKDDRIQMRAYSWQVDTLEEAAAIKGKRMTEWMLDVCMDAAVQIIEDERRIKLDAVAFDEFAQALDETPEGYVASVFCKPAVWEEQ